MKKHIAQKLKKYDEKPGEDDAFVDEQIEKKHRSWKKVKREKPPHKKWND